MQMKFKLWLNIITFAALGVVIFFGWHDIRAAFEKMLTLNLWVLVLVIPAQFFAFYAVARIYYHLFKGIDSPVPMRVLLPLAIELNFVNHIFPSAGVSGFSYFTVRLRREDVSPAKATLVHLLRYVMAFVAFIGLLLLSVLLLAVESRASRLIIFIATALIMTILFSMIVLAYVIDSEYRIRVFTQGLSRLINKTVYTFMHSRPEVIRLDKVELMFRELHKDYMLIRHDLGKMKRAAVWAFISNIAEIGLIYITFVAHGAWVNPGAVAIAYALATLAGLIAILPGGLGVYEPLMAAVLLSAGVPADVAVSATLVSRVATLALALGTGYILYHLTLNRYARDNTERQ
jgi:putative heme transporter